MIERFDPLKGERLRDPRRRGPGRLHLDPALSGRPPGLYERMVLTRAADVKASSSSARAGSARTPRASATKPARSARLRPCPRGLVLPLFPRPGGLPHPRLSPGRSHHHFWMGNEAGMKAPEGSTSSPSPFPSPPRSLHAVGAGMAVKRRKDRAASSAPSATGRPRRAISTRG